MKYHRITNTTDFIGEWAIFNEGLRAAGSEVRPFNDGAFKLLLKNVSRPDSLFLVGNHNGESAACGAAFEFEGELWVYLTYVRPGINVRASEMLELCKKWAKENGFKALIARSELPYDKATRLFRKWGFTQRATEFKLSL